MWTINFWRQVAERALKTAVQSAATVLAIGEGFDVFTVDWRLAASFAISGAVMSVVTSILTAGLGEGDSPSAVAIASAPPEPARDLGNASLDTVVTILVIVVLVLLVVRLV